MTTTTLKLYSLEYKDVKTYLAATLFVLGNLILPQLCHWIPNGGPALLPIYFFTLIAAYKYGWKVGMLTALLSPSVNYILFGMPSLEALPIIVMKSSLLAIIAGLVAQKLQQISILALTTVVLSYQSIGMLGEWVISGSLDNAIQSFRIAIPGMLLQIVGGFYFIKLILKK